MNLVNKEDTHTNLSLKEAEDIKRRWEISEREKEKMSIGRVMTTIIAVMSFAILFAETPPPYSPTLFLFVSMLILAIAGTTILSLYLVKIAKELSERKEEYEAACYVVAMSQDMPI